VRKTKQTLYPEARGLFKELEGVRPYENRDLIDKARLSAAAVSNYRNGYRVPEGEEARRIAEFFYTREDERVGLIERLRRAKEHPQEMTSGKTLVDVTRGSRKLTVSSVDYYPFSGDQNRFFERVFSRFLAQSSLATDNFNIRGAFADEDFSTTDIALSVFESPNRVAQQALHFYKIPARISLQAIVHRRYEHRIEDIARALTRPSDSHLVNPIVVKGEMGAIHCLQGLKFASGAVVQLDSRDPTVLQETLEKKTNSPSALIPVAVTDDFTAMKMIAMGGMGANWRPVFPLNTREQIQDLRDPSRRDLPAYYLSLATQRKDRDFGDFMNEGLRWYYSTDVEHLAVAWQQLAMELAEIVSAACLISSPPGLDLANLDNEQRPAAAWAAAWRWAWYALTLDKHSIDAYTERLFNWQGILRRARNRLQSYFAQPERKNILEAQVKRLFSDDEDPGQKSISQDHLNELQRLFDVELPPGFQDARRYTGKLQHLISIMQAALMGHQPRIHAVITPFDLTEATAARACEFMRRLLLDLLRTYYEIPHAPQEKVNRAEEDIKDLEKVYGKGKGRILIAALKEEPEAYIGGLCLEPMGQPPTLRIQIRHVAVTRDYRSFGVGKKLVGDAIDFARSEQAESIYVELLPHLSATIDFFSSLRFEWDRSDGSQARDKLTFRLKL
jgi:GNAT superfamily N-acetyltransferase